MKTNFTGMLAGIALILCSGLEAGAQPASTAAYETSAVSAQPGSTKMRQVRSKSHREYTYTVLFTNGQQKEVTGRIHFAEEDSTYTLVTKSEVINPSQTQQVYRIDEVSGEKIMGTADGDKWLFPVIEGRINGYSTYAENQPGYVTHLSQQGSPQLYTFDTSRKSARTQTVTMLQELIRDNYEAEQLLREHLQKANKKKLVRNIALGGLGLSVIGVAAAPLATALVVGAPAAIGAGVATATVKTVDLLEVIAVYNNTQAVALF